MLNNLEMSILYLSTCDFISAKKQLEIVDNADITNMLSCFDILKPLVGKVITNQDYASIKDNYDELKFNIYVKNLYTAQICVVTFASNTYPELLKQIYPAPLVLYAKGNVDLLKSQCVAIVGSRKCSNYGKTSTQTFSGALAKSGVTIVSGLSYGVDAIAHEECLKQKGKTIAVLGGGLNNIYPASNTNLAQNIIDNGGLIISEYKPNEKPKVYYFPYRNRIVAGLSKAVLITEASIKSGSMHTKNYALEYGREVFAVPGRITDSYSDGCNKIIQNCQSAIALEPNNILEFLGKKFVENRVDVVQYTLTDTLILDIIGVEEVHYEEILIKSKMDSKELNTALMRLELKNVVKKLPGNYYSK